ncbi:hypothetical protein [Bartonella sp. CM120XJJH]|uniref:hypothetical protein n=1 Tax=Bartonella sp. CM120XJJH TaxID=3243544 RepID=UPI0035CF7A3F
MVICKSEAEDLCFVDCACFLSRWAFVWYGEVRRIGGSVFVNGAEKAGMKGACVLAGEENLGIAVNRLQGGCVKG